MVEGAVEVKGSRGSRKKLWAGEVVKGAVEIGGVSGVGGVGGIEGVEGVGGVGGVKVSWWSGEYW